MRTAPVTRAALAGFLLLVAIPQTALAHEFTVAFVAPFSGPEAARGARALQGFLLATAERDGHAFETSDGHLGGLDSHAVKVDGARGSEFVMARLREIGARQGLAFVTGLLPQEEQVAENWSRATRLAVLVDPRRSRVYQEGTRPAADVRMMNGMSFTAAFQKTRGSAPDADATLGYVAARLIDLTVRSLRGDLTQREVIAAALEGSIGQRW